MAVIRSTTEYDDTSANEGFQAAEAAFRQAEFEIWKSRPQGWLAMAKLQDPKGVIQANFACRPGATTSVTLTLKSDAHEEEALREYSERLFALVDAQLKQA
jgi:Tfp pilus assembly protein PilX